MPSYVFTLESGVVSLSNKKQASLLLSTMEAEYTTAEFVVQRVLWLKCFLDHLDLVPF